MTAVDAKLYFSIFFKLFKNFPRISLLEISKDTGGRQGKIDEFGKEKKIARVNEFYQSLNSDAASREH